MTEATTRMAALEGRGSSRKLVKNWAYLLTSSAFGQFLGMIALIRVARVLSPTGLGHFNLVQTTAGIGLILAGLGMRNTIIRDSARSPERAGALFASGLWVRASFGVLVAAGIVVYAKLSPDALPASLSGFAILLLFGQILWDTSESISYGRQRMEFPSAINALGSVLWVVWIWGAPAPLLTVASVSLSFAALQVLKALALTSRIGPRAPRGGSLSSAGAWGAAQRLVLDSLPFYWLALMTMVQNLLPILVLAERSNSAQVGLYNAGFRLLHPLQLIMGTGLSALYPYLSRARAHDPARYMRTITIAFKMIVIAGSGFALAISLVRFEVVELLFGSAYSGSADAMAFQCWYSVLFGILCLLGTSLAACDKQRWLALLTTAYTLVALPLIWIGTAHGATGLAAGLLAGAAINLVYHWIVFQKSLPNRMDPGVVGRSFILLAGAIGASWLIPKGLALLNKAFLVILVVGLCLTALWREWKRQRNDLEAGGRGDAS